MAYTTINKPSDYFNTVLYTGNGGTQSITGVGFQTDFNWTKCRSTVNNHSLIDVVRGIPETLRCDTTGAETTDTGTITSFDSDGFSISGTNAKVNTNNETYASWNWKAGGTASSNTDGDITSNVSASTTSGFSIVSFTGNGGSDQQVGHGLGTTPTLYITKDRTNGSTNWHYHTTQIDGGMDFGTLNTTDAFASSSLTAPSSTTIRVGGTINTSSANFISYVFAQKKGFSKFGSYTGNGSTDGTFVYTGFKPAFVLIKLTSAGGWVIWDNKRDTFNVADSLLFPHASNAETVTGEQIDILSNGFKARSSNFPNNSGSTLIYMAFAENPLVTTGKIPATAR